MSSSFYISLPPFLPIHQQHQDYRTVHHVARTENGKVKPQINQDPVLTSEKFIISDPASFFLEIWPRHGEPGSLGMDVWV